MKRLMAVTVAGLLVSAGAPAPAIAYDQLVQKQVFEMPS